MSHSSQTTSIENAQPLVIPASMPWLLGVGLVGVYALEWLVATLGSSATNSPVVAWAVSVDLVVVVPVVFGLVAARWMRWPWFSAVPVAFVGLATAHALAPEAANLLHRLELSMAPLELAVLGVIAWRARAGVRRFAAESDAVDGVEAMHHAAGEVVGDGRFAEILATELSVFYYVFGVRKKPLPESREDEFFCRDTSSYGVLVGGLVVATAVEIFPVHLLLQHFWSPVAAWVATGLAIYGAIWLIGDWQAMRRTPTSLTPEALRIRVGLRWRLDVPYETIESMRRVKSSEVRVRGALRALPSGRPSHCIELKAPLRATGPYGIRKTTRRIVLLVDDKERFDREIESVLARQPD